MKRNLFIVALASVLATQAQAGSILFNFDNVPKYTPLPISVSITGGSAYLEGTGQGFSVQAADTLGFTPAGFGGNCIYPNSVFGADLLIQFSMWLTNFSIMYAPEEYACDSSARMRVTAYAGKYYVGTNTTTAPNPGTWPTGLLSFNSNQWFNRVVVHYDAAPPTGGDYGPVFMADNMTVTAVPEPAALAIMVVGVAALIHLRRSSHSA